jgi:hypothetical protein
VLFEKAGPIAKTSSALWVRLSQSLESRLQDRFMRVIFGGKVMFQAFPSKTPFALDGHERIIVKEHGGHNAYNWTQ